MLWLSCGWTSSELLHQVTHQVTITFVEFPSHNPHRHIIVGMKIFCLYFVFMLGDNPTHMGGLTCFHYTHLNFVVRGLKPTKPQLHKLFTIPPNELVESINLAFQTFKKINFNINFFLMTIKIDKAFMKLSKDNTKTHVWSHKGQDFEKYKKNVHWVSMGHET
jgi:hypothetical protein